MFWTGVSVGIILSFIFYYSKQPLEVTTVKRKKVKEQLKYHKTVHPNLLKETGIRKITHFTKKN